MAKQRFYIWSQAGDGCVLAWRLKHEGYDVVLRIEELWMRSNLDGIVEKTSRMPRISDIVVFDSVGSGSQAAELQRSGYAVIGASELADELELDRAHAMQTFVDCGMQVPVTMQCESISEAIELVKTQQGQWVFKPSGHQECAATYVARDELDMIEMLLHFQGLLGDNVASIMQQKLEGVCVSTEGWFDGERWVEGSFNSTIEAKDLLVGSIGPKTGCEWCMVWGYAGVPEIALQVHEKFSEKLQEDGYVGPWDFNCIVNAKGIFVLEPTPRFGYDAIEGLCAIMQRPLGEMLIALVEQDTLWPVALDEVGMALRVEIPPYPFASEKHLASGDIPIRFRHEDASNLWLTGVRRIKSKLVSSPTDGTVGVIAASAKSEEIWQLSNQLKTIARKLAIPDLMWRDDPGNGVEGMWLQLMQLGYETPLSQRVGYGEMLALPTSNEA